MLTQGFASILCQKSDRSASDRTCVVKMRFLDLNTQINTIINTTFPRQHSLDSIIKVGKGVFPYIVSILSE